MRIAIVSNIYPPYAVGGAEIAAHRQACGFRDAGHEVAVFTGLADILKPPYQISSDTIDQLPVTRVILSPSRLKASSNFQNPLIDAAFDDFCQDFQPDVVHFHNLAGLSLSMLNVCSRRSTPTMITFHDYWGYCLRNTLLRPGADRPCPDWSECHVCEPAAFFGGQLTPIFLRTSYVRFQLHKAKLFHFPSLGLMHDYAEADFDLTRSVQHSLGLADAPVLDREPRRARLQIVFSGRLSRHKGPQILLGALEHLRDEGLDDRFEISLFGEGELRGELQSWIDDKDWGDAVLLKGACPNSVVRAAYAQADLGVNASIWPENEPVSVLEALKAGTPVVASAIGGNPEIIEDGVNGWLYEAGSSTALARLLRDLEASRLQLEGMRQSVSASVASRTAAAMQDFLLTAYAALRDGPAPASPSIVALICRDYGDVDGEVLHRASRTGYWRRSEWLPWTALQCEQDFEAVVAVIWLNGPLPQGLDRLAPETAIVTLEQSRGSLYGGFQNVVALHSLSELPVLGEFMERVVERNDAAMPSDP